MAKSSPEKLAAALRANLKRRKPAKPAPSQEPPAGASAKPAKKPAENRN
jgi:hypothetical protein